MFAFVGRNVMLRWPDTGEQVLAEVVEVTGGVIVVAYNGGATVLEPEPAAAGLYHNPDDYSGAGLIEVREAVEENS